MDRDKMRWDGLAALPVGVSAKASRRGTCKVQALVGTERPGFIARNNLRGFALKVSLKVTGPLSGQWALIRAGSFGKKERAMIGSKSLLVAVISGGLGMGTLQMVHAANAGGPSGAPSIQKLDEDTYPHMRRALHDLRAAKESLLNAEPKFHGHRDKAIDRTWIGRSRSARMRWPKDELRRGQN